MSLWPTTLIRLATFEAKLLFDQNDFVSKGQSLSQFCHRRRSGDHKARRVPVFDRALAETSKR